jgi:hypothetical protein
LRQNRSLPLLRWGPGAELKHPELAAVAVPRARPLRPSPGDGSAFWRTVKPPESVGYVRVSRRAPAAIHDDQPRDSARPLSARNPRPHLRRATMAARELGTVSLADALALTLLTAETGDDRWPRAAARWRTRGAAGNLFLRRRAYRAREPCRASHRSTGRWSEPRPSKDKARPPS